MPEYNGATVRDYSGARMPTTLTELLNSLKSITSFGGNGMGFLGDSITAVGSGGLLKPDVGWPAQVCMKSKGRIKFVVNAGIGGNTTAQMLARIQTDVIAHKPAFCTVLGGTNDPDAATAIAGLKAIYTALREAGIIPIAITVPPRNVDPGGKPCQINAWLAGYAEQNNIQVLDFYSLLVDSTTGQFKAEYTSDGTHPNGIANGMLAEYAYPILSDMVPRWTPYLSQCDPDNANLVPLPLFKTNRLLGDNSTQVTDTPRGYTTSGRTNVTWAMVTVPEIPGRAQKFTFPATSGLGANQSLMTSNQGAAISPIPLTAGKRYRFSIHVQTTGCLVNNVGLIATITTNDAGSTSFGLNGNSGADVTDGIFTIDFTAPEGTTGARIAFGAITNSALSTEATATFGQPTVTLIS